MAKQSKDPDAVSYGPTPMGQLIYDLGFAKLKDATIARKHGMTLEQVRSARAAFDRGFKAGKKEERQRRQKRRQRDR